MQQQAQFWRNVARTKQNKQQRARRRLVAESLESRLALAAFNDGNLLVTNSPFDQTPMLYEYTVDGQQVQAVPLTHPSGVATERPRDVVVDMNGNAQIFNGTYDPKLTTYDPVAGTFVDTTVPYWTTGNNITYGGLTAQNEFVFATDQRVRSESAADRGVVRFSVNNLTSGWTQDFNANIGDSITNTSKTTPHITLQGTGNGSFDYYSFNVATAGAKGVFDIDGGDTGAPGSFHSELRLFDHDGNLLTQSAIYNSPTLGQSGSTSDRDAYLEYTFTTPGQYMIEVGGCCAPEGVPAGATYQLQVSLTGHSLYAPGGSGLINELEPNDTRFNPQNTDSAERFGSGDGDPIDVNVGLDGLLYALIYTGSVTGGGNLVKVYDPATLQLVRTVTLPQEHRALAVDQAGHIYASQPGIYHYDANGVLLNTIANPVGGFLGDIDIKAGSCVAGVAGYPCLAVASNNGYVVVTDTSLSNFDFFPTRQGAGQTFVAFVDKPLNLPRATDDVYRVTEDTTSNTLAVLVNDLVHSEGKLTITGVSAPTANGTVSIIGGKSLRYSPAANFAGTETFTYMVSDGLGGVSQARVTVDVSNINEDPTTQPDVVTVPEDSADNVIDVLANDTSMPDVGETLTIASVTQGSNGGVVSIQGALVYYTPASNFAGAETFTYRIEDGHGGAATGTVTVTVTNSNDNPTIVADSFAVNPNSANNFLDVLANDSSAPDSGETLTITGFTPTSHGSLVLFGTQLRYTPTAGYLGPDSFSYSVADGNGGTGSATVSLTVTVVNNPPIAGADSYQIGRNSVNNRLKVLANDTFAPDINETLTILGTTSPSRGGLVTIVNNGTELRYTPLASFSGTETFSYSVGDGRGGSATALVTIQVGNFNSPPAPENDSYTLLQNSTNNVLSVLANDFDPDGSDVLSIVAIGSTSMGGIVGLSADHSSLVYSPPQPFLGVETFTYTVDDGRGGLTDATVTITVVGWQNPANPLDVDKDTFISSQDAVVMVNEINVPQIISPSGQLPPPTVNPRYFYDVNGDGYLTASDVLKVVNALNAAAAAGGEAPRQTDDAIELATAASLALTSPVDAIASQLAPLTGVSTSPTASAASAVGSTTADSTSPVLTIDDAGWIELLSAEQAARRRTSR
ncbi:MAG TPA: Ig-like domain-containing protein [Pirellulaceae bacterium]|nr:Ig-like domain-containing protein [Pirellulaceae bacterium]